MSSKQGIKKIEIEKRDGKFHINLIKDDDCTEDEEINDDTIRKISNSLNGKGKKSKNLFTGMFFGDNMLEKSMTQKQNYRQAV